MGEATRAAELSWFAMSYSREDQAIREGVDE